MRWDVAAGDYLYTREPLPGQAGAATDHPLPITVQDKFTVDDGMLRVLADRSARWSLRKEIGKGPDAAGSRPKFVDRAREVMIAAGGVDYMRDKILESIQPGSPPEFFAGGIKGWSPTRRTNFINALHADPARRCDLYLTVHLNALTNSVDGRGTAVLVDDTTTTAGPIRTAKLFIKYLDPLSRGLQRGGVVRNDAGMLNASNRARDVYAYFETEFMTSTTARDPSLYNYEDMVRDPYLSSTAEQLVAAIVEALDGPQSDLDTITLNDKFKSGGVTFW
jgi:hypothetical protein